MQFNSQICTAREQSEGLLALGLKAETADCVMMYYDGWHIGEAEHFDFDKDPVVPAWSLHRLIEIYDKTCIFWSDCFDNPYEAMISRIAYKIKWGELNKEYLEGE